MDITPAIVHASKASRPKPDLPPGAKLVASKKPKGKPSVAAGKPGYKTAKVNGKWVIVPINGGNSDPALRPHIYVKPLNG